MKSFTYILMVCLLFAFAGCKKEQAVKKPMAEKVKPAEAKIVQKPAAEPAKAAPEEIGYDSKGKRDPFLSLIEITKQKPMKKRGASPFESYDVEEIRLLAIAWANNKYYALIKLPDKKNYTIVEGMTIGLQGGKIEKITKDTVVVREFIKDYRGNLKPRDTILKLHKGEEE